MSTQNSDVGSVFRPNYFLVAEMKNSLGEALMLPCVESMPLGKAL
jgi:hypothetical protein